MIVVAIFSMKIEVGFLLLVWMLEQSLHVQSDRNQSLEWTAEVKVSI